MLLNQIPFNIAKVIEPKHLGVKYNKRERFLTPQELKVAWSFFPHDPVQRQLWRMLMLTGRRVGETWKSRREDIRDGKWFIPAENRKVKVDDVLPMTESMIGIVDYLDALGHSDWITCR